MTYPKPMMLDPVDLEPNPWNTNIVTPENERKLEASIKRLGFFRPVIVREIAKSPNSETGYQILGGEHRAETAVRLGINQIPVINLGPIDDLQAKEIGIADNARYGVDDTIAERGPARGCVGDHAVGDGAADGGVGNEAVGRRGRGGAHVALADTPAAAGAGEGLPVDAELTGNAAGARSARSRWASRVA